jgi:hypothetical protein
MPQLSAYLRDARIRRPGGWLFRPARPSGTRCP